MKPVTPVPFGSEPTVRLESKILLILALIILSVTTAVTIYNIVEDQRQNALRMEQAYQSVRLSYEETLSDTIHFYTSRANTHLYSPGVLEAFRGSDRETIYRLLKVRWELLKQENPSLLVMHFHKADGTSLLRMHQPEVYGDAIAARRPMVAHIHRHHRPVSGFEEGRNGLAFRILTPVIDHGKYLGAVEFGIAANYITDKIYRHSGYESFFLLQEEALGNLARIRNHFHMGNYIALDVPAKLLPLAELYRKQNGRLEDRVITYGRQSFAMTTFPVSNYLGKTSGRIMFIVSVPDIWNHIFHMIVASFMIAVALIVVLGLLIHRIYHAVSTRLSFQELYNQTILDAIPSPVIVTNGHQLIAANRTFLSYFHYSSVESFKEDHACVCEYFEEGDTNEYLMPMRNEQRWTHYIMNHPELHHKAKITMDGTTTVFDVKLSALRFEEEERYVVIFTDISSMQNLSVTDPLTGIANRLHFTMVYEHAFKVAFRERKPLGMIFLDIDHFKRINDRYGHLMGDSVLKRIAKVIQQRIRKSDIVARWGGEEFIILLPETPIEDTARLAETLRKAIENEPFETGEQVTCSFGATAMLRDDSPETLLKRSDELLYAAKAGGRNRVLS